MAKDTREARDESQSEIERLRRRVAELEASCDQLRRAETALHESEERYRTLVESIGEGVVAVDSDENFIFVNRVAAEILGLEPDELIGRSLKEFVTDEQWRLIREQTNRRRDGELGMYEIRVTRPDGQVRDVAVTATPKYGEVGGFVGAFGVFRDVTDEKCVDKALEESRRKIEVLHETARRLEACQTQDEVCGVAVDAAKKVLGFPLCLVHVAVGNSLVLKTASSDLPPGMDVEQAAAESQAALKAYRTRTSVIFGAADGDEEPGRSCFGSGICVPFGDCGVFEVLAAESAAFDARDARLLELLLGHATEASRGIQLRSELHEQAIRDPLTGLYNRRFFTEAIQQEIERCRRYGHKIGFLMIDVDRFKEINDTLGHQTGDSVLCGVARFLRGMVRASEMVVRYGGDEFLIVMPETGSEAEFVRARLQRAFRGWAEEIAPEGFPIRLSIGFDFWEPGGGRSLEEVLARADDRMYEDKKAHSSASTGAESSSESDVWGTRSP